LGQYLYFRQSSPNKIFAPCGAQSVTIFCSLFLLIAGDHSHINFQVCKLCLQTRFLCFPLAFSFGSILRDAEQQIKEAGTYSIALDYWTSVAKDKYLAITYHYADKDLNVRSRVLDLVPVGGNATALLTSQLVEQRLEKHFEQKRAIFK
jgi:hypothetical protein